MGVLLSLLLTACSGGITTSQPLEMDWGGTTTAPTTAKTTAPTGTTGSTKAATTWSTIKTTRQTTAPTKPWSMYDPDPEMSLEEYLSEMRVPDEERLEYGRMPGAGKIVVYMEREKPLESLHTGSIYWWDGTAKNEENYRLLRDCRAETYSNWGTDRLGYTYVAVDGDVYRYRNDGAEEKLMFEGEEPIVGLAADDYALYIMTRQGIYRLFRPTGQLDRLCDPLDSKQSNLQMLSNDILISYELDTRHLYVISLDRWVNQSDVIVAFGGSYRRDKEFCRFVYTYCEEHPE